jgi:hypothetical protein
VATMVVHRERDAELEAMARVLDALAEQLRAMMVGGAVDETPSEGEEGSRFSAGRKVRIVVRDKYYGQTATLLSRRGRMYWNIRLEGRDGEIGREMYKAETSLRVVDSG